MAELLQGAFQCAWPGFSTEFARMLTRSAEGTVGIPASAVGGVCSSLCQKTLTCVVGASLSTSASKGCSCSASMRETLAGELGLWGSWAP